jgi:hypothetical protein
MAILVKPAGLCSMCQLGTTHFSRCPQCGVMNCRHLAREHEFLCIALGKLTDFQLAMVDSERSF